MAPSTLGLALHPCAQTAACRTALLVIIGIDPWRMKAVPLYTAHLPQDTGVHQSSSNVHLLRSVPQTQRDHPNSHRWQAPLPVPVHLLVQSSSPHQQISLQRAQQTCERSPQLSAHGPEHNHPLPATLSFPTCIPPPLPVPWTALSQLQTVSLHVSSTQSCCAATKPHPFFPC